MSSAIDVISHLLRRRWEGVEGQKVIVRLFDTVVNSNKGGGSFLSLPQLVCCQMLYRLDQCQRG